jgi:ribose transport system substrate-binding protein
VIDQAKALVAAARTGYVTGAASDFVPIGEITVMKSFPSPTPAKRDLTAKKPKVFIVACGPTGACPRMAKGTQHILKDVFGWDSTLDIATFGPGDTTQSVYTRELNKAINANPDIIVAYALAGILVQQQLEQAKAKGIIVLDGFQGPESGTGYSGYVPYNYNIQKELLAAYAIADSNGKAKVLVPNVVGVPNLMSIPAVQLLQQCAGCEVRQIDEDSSVSRDPIKQTEVLANEMLAHPGFNYIIAQTLGSANIYASVAPALQAQNSKLQILIPEQDPAGINLLQGGLATADAYVPAEWLVYGMIDAVIRAANKEPIPDYKAWKFGASLWTKDTAPKGKPTIVDLQHAALKQFDYSAPYAKAWGVSADQLIIPVS